ncbi:hypothetical protein [Microbacterium sp. H1-D42]|uniref:hypothetical protein n=1 Tax=Microbacterium sp. H1-D42 TaxID=2925844 RepID=UPI001F53CD64|nr:hypothetical protein [Microbacterium sp. H1-D42]UNK72238.1 hypothetical protein MNR00_07290 [Microbacterium sp. H1-D42]
MSRTGDASAHARMRLRSFNGVVTVFGLILILIIGIVTFANGGSATPDSGRTTTSDDYYYPWENPAPIAATADGETWSGRGQQYIPLTGLTPGAPLALAFLDDSEFSDYFLTPGAAGESEEAVSFYSYSDVGDYLIPSAAEMTLWPRTRTDDPWTVRIKPAGIETVSGTVSGTSSRTFLYAGPATAARVTVSGHTTIDIVTEQGVEDNYPWFEDGSQSIAWPNTNSAVFTVDSSGDSSWTIEFYEPAPQSSATPTSTPTPTGAADE